MKYLPGPKELINLCTFFYKQSASHGAVSALRYTDSFFIHIIFLPSPLRKREGGKKDVLYNGLVDLFTRSLFFSPWLFIHHFMSYLHTHTHTHPLLQCLCVFSCQLHVNHYFVAHKFESKMFQFQADRRTLRYKKPLEYINLGESSAWLKNKKKNLKENILFFSTSADSSFSGCPIISC